MKSASHVLLSNENSNTTTLRKFIVNLYLGLFKWRFLLNVVLLDFQIYINKSKVTILSEKKTPASTGIWPTLDRSWQCPTKRMSLHIDVKSFLMQNNLKCHSCYCELELFCQSDDVHERYVTHSCQKSESVPTISIKTKLNKKSNKIDLKMDHNPPSRLSAAKEPIRVSQNMTWGGSTHTHPGLCRRVHFWSSGDREPFAVQTNVGWSFVFVPHHLTHLAMQHQHMP